MTLEDFKDVYKDKTPVEMLDLLAEQHATWRHDAVAREKDRDSIDGGAYYANECCAMEARVEWIMGRLKDALKAQEPVEPTRKPELFDSLYFCQECSAKVGFQIRKDDSWRFKYKYCPNCGRKVKWDG